MICYVFGDDVVKGQVDDCQVVGFECCGGIEVVYVLQYGRGYQDDYYDCG